MAALPTGAAAAAGPAPEAASIRSDCSAIWWIERDTGGKSVASEMRKARERELSRRRLLLSFDGENGIASGVRQRARAEVGHRQREPRKRDAGVVARGALARTAAEEFLLVACPWLICSPFLLYYGTEQ